MKTLQSKRLKGSFTTVVNTSYGEMEMLISHATIHTLGTNPTKYPMAMRTTDPYIYEKKIRAMEIFAWIMEQYYVSGLINDPDYDFEFCQLKLRNDKDAGLLMGLQYVFPKGLFNVAMTNDLLHVTIYGFENLWHEVENFIIASDPYKNGI